MASLSVSIVSSPERASARPFATRVSRPRASSGSARLSCSFRLLSPRPPYWKAIVLPQDSWWKIERLIDRATPKSTRDSSSDARAHRLRRSVAMLNHGYPGSQRWAKVRRNETTTKRYSVLRCVGRTQSAISYDRRLPKVTIPARPLTGQRRSMKLVLESAIDLRVRTI